MKQPAFAASPVLGVWRPIPSSRFAAGEYSPDAGCPFQNADETRFAGTVLSEDDCHAWREIDLCAGLERIDARPQSSANRSGRLRVDFHQATFLRSSERLERARPRASSPIAAVSDNGRCRGQPPGIRLGHWPTVARAHATAGREVVVDSSCVFGLSVCVGVDGCVVFSPELHLGHTYGYINLPLCL